MTDQADHVPGDSQLLLVYLADELPPAERRHVEERLAQDARFRQELESLRQTQDFCFTALSRLDLHSRPVSSTAALRKTSRLIEQWARDRQTLRIAPPPAPHRSSPWLRYGLAAAALVMITFLGHWVLNFSEQLPAHRPIANNYRADPDESLDDPVKPGSDFIADPPTETMSDLALVSPAAEASEWDIFKVPSSASGNP